MPVQGRQGNERAARVDRVREVRKQSDRLVMVIQRLQLEHVAQADGPPVVAARGLAWPADRGASFGKNHAWMV